MKHLYERLTVRANAFNQAKFMVDGYSYAGRSYSKSSSPLKKTMDEAWEDLLECPDEVVEKMKLMYNMGHHPLPPLMRDVDDYVANMLGRMLARWRRCLSWVSTIIP